MKDEELKAMAEGISFEDLAYMLSIKFGETGLPKTEWFIERRDKQEKIEGHLEVIKNRHYH